MSLTYQELLVTLPALLEAGSVPNLVGEAGIGKSSLVAEVAKRMGATLLTTVVSLAEKGDLALPVPPLTKDSLVTTSRFGTLADVKYGYSTTLLTLLKEAEARPGQPIIWFLDEFNRGNAAVQSELMNLVLQRQIHTLTLPEEVHIILAQNPDPTMDAAGDYAVTPSDAAVRDRTVRLKMRANLTDWLTWAEGEVDGTPRVQPVVVDYLREHPNLLAPAPVVGQIMPTPRSWERASRNLTSLRKLPAAQSRAVLADVLAGDLGEEVGVDLAQVILTPAVGIEELLSAPSPVTEMVAPLPESNRLDLVNQWLGQAVPLDLATLPRVVTLLKSLSADGRVWRRATKLVSGPICWRRFTRRGMIRRLALCMNYWRKLPSGAPAMVEGERQLQAAVIDLLKKDHSAGVVLVNIKRISDPLQSTLNLIWQSNDLVLAYNPAWVKEEPLRELTNLLHHLALHVLWYHPYRYRDAFDPAAVAIATDVAVNQYLEESPAGTVTLVDLERATKQRLPRLADSAAYLPAARALAPATKRQLVGRGVGGERPIPAWVTPAGANPLLMKASLKRLTKGRAPHFDQRGRGRFLRGKTKD